MRADPTQWRKALFFILLMSGWMFYFAFDIWMDQEDPCQRSKKYCSLAQALSDLAGVERYTAYAQMWGAMGLMFLFISYQIWRNREKKKS